MRSGSSMTGSLFNSHPDVFYWFEPLHSMGMLHGQKFRDMDKWKKRHQFSSSDEAVGNMTAVLNCDIRNVFMSTLMDGFMSHSTATGAFKHCFRNGSRDMVLKHSSTLWDACVRNLTAVCQKNYRVIATKTIRFRMSRAVELLKKDPGLKVLHLVRDPRGVLESRKRLGFAKFSELHAEAKNLCEGITDDLKFAQSMKEKDVKARYMLARYEDIAKSPIIATKLLHHFMGLEPSEAGLRRATRISKTAPGKRKLCATCAAEASNSTARSQEWRQVADLKNVQVINDHCSELMAQLGYRLKFSTEDELQDLRVTSVEEPRLEIATSFIQNVSEEKLP